MQISKIGFSNFTIQNTNSQKSNFQPHPIMMSSPKDEVSFGNANKIQATAKELIAFCKKNKINYEIAEEGKELIIKTFDPETFAIVQKAVFNNKTKRLKALYKYSDEEAKEILLFKSDGKTLRQQLNKDNIM